MQSTRKRSHMEVVFQKLEEHMLFICPECGESYMNQQQWRQHLNFHHDYLCKKPEDFGFVEVNERFHECQTCKVMVADGKRAIALLQYHHFIHLPYSKTYRCRHCASSFSRKRVLCEHLCRNHEEIVCIDKTATENTSNKINASSGQLRTVSSQYAKENPEFFMNYVCPQCGVLIENYKKWITHVRTEHCDVVRPDCEMQRVSGTKNYYCKLCRKVIFSSDNARLQRHYFTHLPYKVNFNCAYCKVRRAYKTELLHHFIRTHIREFETQRAHIQKPKEWGAEINEKLDKELDFLLEHGNVLGGGKRQKSIELSSTTLPSSYSKSNIAERQQRNQQRPLLQQPDRTKNSSHSSTTLGKPQQQQQQQDQQKQQQKATESTINVEMKKLAVKEIVNDNNVPIVKSYLDEFIQSQKRNRWDEMNQNQHQNQIQIQQKRKRINKKERTESNEKPKNNALEALVSEIFDDIDMEINDQTVQKEDKSSDAKNESSTVLPDDEEIVSIEINALDENDLNELRANEEESENVEEVLKEKQENQTVFPTIKSLFNAKVLHLCPTCGDSFNDQSAWRNHVLNAHENLNKMLQNNYKLLDNDNDNQDSSNLCLQCMQVLTTSNKSELQRHLFTHMPYHSYLKCTLCDAVKSNKAKMLVHLEVDHRSLIKTCDTADPIPEDIIPINGVTKNVTLEQAPSSIEAKMEYSHLMKHLLNARDRLNQMIESKSINYY